MVTSPYVRNIIILCNIITNQKLCCFVFFTHGSILKLYITAGTLHNASNSIMVDTTVSSGLSSKYNNSIMGERLQMFLMKFFHWYNLLNLWGMGPNLIFIKV